MERRDPRLGGLFERQNHVWQVGRNRQFVEFCVVRASGESCARRPKNHGPNSIIRFDFRMASISPLRTAWFDALTGGLSMVTNKGQSAGFINVDHHQEKAWRPVMPRPIISAWTSCVPS